MDHPMWTSEKFSSGQAWIDLLGMARWKPTTDWVAGRRIDVKRGQVRESVKNLAHKWGWSRGKVYRFLDELKTEHMIEHQNLTVSSLITITNYEQYQGSGTLDGTPDRTPDGTPDGTPDPNKSLNTKTPKPPKKVKKEKKERSNTGVPELGAWLEYAKERGMNIQAAEKSYDHYLANGWKQKGGNPIKDWKAALRTGHRNDKEWHPEKYAHEQTSFLDRMLDMKRQNILKKLITDTDPALMKNFDSYADGSKSIPPHLKSLMEEEYAE